MTFRDDITELSFMCIYGRFLHRMNSVFASPLICSLVRSNLHAWLGTSLLCIFEVLMLFKKRRKKEWKERKLEISQQKILLKLKLPSSKLNIHGTKQCLHFIMTKTICFNKILHNLHFSDDM